MKVLFDYQIFEEQKIGGISRYFFELYKHFTQDPDIEIKLPINYSSNNYLKGMKEYESIPDELIHPYQKFLSGIRFKGKRKLYSMFNSNIYSESNQEKSINAIKGWNFDVFHPSYYYPYFIESIKHKPLIVTVHDLIIEKFPEFFPNDRITSKNKELVIKRADRIITVSETTKMDLLDIYNISEEKVKVVYLGNSINQTYLNQPCSLQLPERYLLYIGARGSYKNFIFFVEAIKKVLLNDPDLKLICVGFPFTASESEYFKISGINNNLITIFVDDSLLAHLYSKAIAFVFPSLYEGFGIPVLEAFSCGCPCLLSNVSSLPEIGGDSAIYFDPHSSESIRETVERIVENKELRQELDRKGREQLKKFSWETTASQTVDIYKMVV
jgi:glycosyltransferase involved in cell wall biosynthesis